MAGLYLHIPFCKKKCLYCDFYSVPVNIAGRSSIERYLNSVEQEIHFCTQGNYSEEEFTTIFFGGGTPSLLSPDQYAALLDTLSTSFKISPIAEITLEVNPGTVNKLKLKEFYDIGVNRLSIGVQSFFDDELAFLSRIHSSRDALAAVQDAKEVGFQNISIDLLYAFPHHSKERWRKTLEQAIALDVQHLSCYNLIIEAGTPLFEMVQSHAVVPLSNEEEADFFLLTDKILGSHDYEHYEISNFSKPGFQCKHNIGYWTHEPYLGFGPSAHSYWDKQRWWNIADLNGYCEMIDKKLLPVAGGEHLTESELKEEVIYLGLRSEGIVFQRYLNFIGKDFQTEYRLLIQELVEKNLAKCEADRFRLTPQGYALCDEICQQFL